MCINNTLAFGKVFLDTKSHEGFSVVFEMSLGLFVLLIRVSDSCWFTVYLGSHLTSCSQAC